MRPLTRLQLNNFLVLTFSALNLEPGGLDIRLSCAYYDSTDDKYFRDHMTFEVSDRHRMVIASKNDLPIFISLDRELFDSLSKIMFDSRLHNPKHLQRI